VHLNNLNAPVLNVLTLQHCWQIPEFLRNGLPSSSAVVKSFLSDYTALGDEDTAFFQNVRVCQPHHAV